MSEYRESVQIPPVTHEEGFHLRPFRALERIARILLNNRVAVVLASGDMEASIRSLDTEEFHQAALYRGGETIGFSDVIRILDSLPPENSCLILSGREADVQNVLEYTRGALQRLVDGWNRGLYLEPLPFFPAQRK